MNYMAKSISRTVSFPHMEPIIDKHNLYPTANILDGARAPYQEKPIPSPEEIAEANRLAQRKAFILRRQCFPGEDLKADTFFQRLSGASAHAACEK